MYNFEKNSCVWIGILVFAMVLVYMRCTNAVEPFVIKGETEIGAVLFDQNDMAAVMNGLKPSNITGDYTAADMKELVRLFKIQGMKELFGETVNTFNTKSAGYDYCAKNENSDKCKLLRKIFKLISEQNDVFRSDPTHLNITNKDEYLRHLMKTLYDIMKISEEEDSISGPII